MTQALFTAEQAEEYTQSLGQILGGGWRQVEWAQRAGIPEALGLTTREWVEKRLSGYVKLNKADRRKALAEPELKALSSRQAADVLGVDQKTIVNDRSEENSSGQLALDAPAERVPIEGEENSPPESELDQQRRLRGERDGKSEAKRVDRDRREASVLDVSCSRHS